MSEQKIPPRDVPQIVPDGLAFCIEPDHVAIVLATRCHVYTDGTVEQRPLPTAVIRMSPKMIEFMIGELQKGLAEVEAQVKARREAITNAAQLPLKLVDPPKEVNA